MLNVALGIHVLVPCLGKRRLVVNQVVPKGMYMEYEAKGVYLSSTVVRKTRRLLLFVFLW